MNDIVSDKHAEYDVYVAGPFFNEKQLKSMEALEKVLEDNGYSMFRPRFDSVHLTKDSSKEDMRKAFEDDLDAIEGCSVVIANTLDKDMGTLFEVGYAYAKGVPVLGYADGLPEGAAFNLMLASTMVGVVRSPAELQEWIDGKNFEYDGDVE